MFGPWKSFPTLFRSLGKLQRTYHIQLKEGAKPLALTAQRVRRVPVPLLPKVKAELDRMKQFGVIAPVKEPTDWCSGMVVVPKPQNKVRIYVDLTQLNKSVHQEHYQLPAVEQTLAQLAGVKAFSKLDADSRFWQIPLSPELSLLTTFITPFGHFCFRRLPFGITSAPEHFQCQMTKILQDMEHPHQFPRNKEDLHKTVDKYVCEILSTVPATDSHIKRIQKCQEEDEECQKLVQYCNNGWPNKKAVPSILKPYYQVVSQLSVVDGLLLRGVRIVAPRSLHLEVLDQIHASHQGIQKCRQRAA